MSWKSRFCHSRTYLCWSLVGTKTYANISKSYLNPRVRRLVVSFMRHSISNLRHSFSASTLSSPSNIKGRSRLNVIQGKTLEPGGLLDQQHLKAFDLWWNVWPLNHPRPCCYGNTVPEAWRPVSANLINTWTSSEISSSLEGNPIIHDYRKKCLYIHWAISY